MEQRGVRDLKVNASAVLALVKRGETVEITQRGVPVARLVPVPATPDTRSLLQRDIDEGRVTAAQHDFADWVPLDIPRPPGTPTLTEILLLQRADER
jgi:prevent-host-death family protein